MPNSDLLLAAPLAAFVVFAAWRWSRHRPEDPARLEKWLERFSPDSYLPMLRLADGKDQGYLEVQRGPEAVVLYRQMQRQILREYLRILSRDFHRLHILASRGFVRVPLVLAEEKVKFVFALWRIKLRLLRDKSTLCAIHLQPLLANVGELTVRAREGVRLSRE